MNSQGWAMLLGSWGVILLLTIYSMYKTMTAKEPAEHAGDQSQA